MHKAITIKYELKDSQSGEILESNLEGEAISFVSGFEQILQKLEDEVISMQTGDEKVVKFDAKDGFGEYDDDKIQVLPKEQFAGIELEIGMELIGENEGGETVKVIVKDIADENVTIDFNHPYSGKNLEFKIQMIENREATDDEISNRGIAHQHACGCGCDHHEHEEHEHHCCGGHGHHHKHHHDGHCCQDKE
jgi:peptidyl-prolyl cis-trans isomerase